jgi:hypothetical protein
MAPPEQPLPLFRLFRTVADNPVKAWPRAVYRERLVRALGRDAIYVMAPDLIRRVLVDDADHFERGELARRALGPALGDAILDRGWIQVAPATSCSRAYLSSRAESGGPGRGSMRPAAALALATAGVRSRDS